jgi:hypothetical protein
MTLETEPAPIACTLGAGDYKERQAWIAGLNAASLQDVKQEDLRLELTYAASARKAVLELARREQDCCGFLSFIVSELPGQVRLTITAPERAREAGLAMFETFRLKTTDSGSGVAVGCGCPSACA